MQGRVVKGLSAHQVVEGSRNLKLSFETLTQHMYKDDLGYMCISAIFPLQLCIYHCILSRLGNA